MNADAAQTMALHTGPQRLVKALTRLGPLFMKMGQFLSLRPDLLPQEYCDELLGLTDAAPWVAWDEIRDVIREDLGDWPEDLFATISARPLAAGSIAQAHAATTRDGRTVVVKVQRPGLARRIERDLRRLRLLARMVDAIGLLPQVSARELAVELARWLREELDFDRELHQQARLFRAMAKSGIARIPEPIAALSRGRVLTSDQLQGTLFSDLLRHRRGGQGERITQAGLDVEVLAERLIQSSFEQLFTLRLFHADPHPGNLVALPGNVIGYVDFGRVDVLPRSVEDAQFRFLFALYEENPREMYRAISDVIEAGADSDADAFRREFLSETSRWLALPEDEHAVAAGRTTTSEYMILLMQLARRHRMRVPPSILSMYRTLLTVESVARELGARSNLSVVGRRFFADRRMERLIGGLEPEQALAWLMQVGEVSRQAPGQLQELLSDLAEGRFVLTVQREESAQQRRAANQRARLVSLSVVSAGLALILAIAPALEPVVRGLLWGALALAYVGVALIWIRMK